MNFESKNKQQGYIQYTDFLAKFQLFKMLHFRAACIRILHIRIILIVLCDFSKLSKAHNVIVLNVESMRIYVQLSTY